jgi:hypothetical protein
LRRVTQPPHIAGPLCLSRHAARTRQILDNNGLNITS